MTWSWQEIAAVWVMIWLVLQLLLWRFRGRQRSTHGAAQWCQVWQAFRARLFKSGGLYVGDWVGRLGVFYHGAHAITFGVTGSGKGISAILPNAARLDRLFMIDPGGENTAIAAKGWLRSGVSLFCINGFGMFTEAPWQLPEHGFNALDLLDPASPTFAADALLLAEMLTPRAGNEGGNTNYFKDSSESAKRAMLIHIKTTEPAERQNVGTLYEYAYSNADDWEALITAMKANPVCGDLVRHEANKLERIEAQAPEEFSAIMSTIQQDLSFLADPRVRDFLSRSDVDFSVLKKRRGRGAVISVVMPLQFMQSHAAIPRLAMACAILVLEQPPYARRKVTFLIDEAAALGKINRLPNWLATLRKYNVRVWTIWQNIGQVADLYGTNWQTLVSNCGLMQILGVGDLQTAQYTQAMIGSTTVRTESVNARGEVSISHTARPLVMAEELLRTDTGKQIVLIENLWPLLLSKTPYWKQPGLAGRFHPNPYLGGRARQPGILDEIAQSLGNLYYLAVWWLAPHWLAGCIYAVPVLLGAGHLFGGGS